MIAYAVVLMTAAVAYAQLPTDCGRTPIRPNLNQRIVGGKEAVVGSWPWQVLFRYNGGQLCGGSIIASNYIITAAHCTEDRTPSGFTFHAGRHRVVGIEANEQVASPQTVWQHENYVRPNNDISLIRTRTKFTFNNYVQPVCLPTSEITTTGRDMYATGWGEVQGTCCEGRLKQARLLSLNRFTCSQLWNGRITNAMICAGQEAGDSTCMGDSGGPLVTEVNGKWELHGATSFGKNRTCSVAGPPVFANVYHFDRWIRSKITAVEAEEAEVAARGVRPIPYGAAYRQIKQDQEQQQQQQQQQLAQQQQVEQQVQLEKDVWHEHGSDVEISPF